MNKFFDCFIFLLVFVFFTGAQAAESAYKTRQYFEQDRDAYVRGATAYLQALPPSCRYRQSFQENQTLPGYFVMVEVRVAPHLLSDRPFFQSSTTNFAAALDSLLHTPTSESKWIIDSIIATEFAELQGIRCMMAGNDELFNQWCRNNLSKDSNGFATNFHNNFYMSEVRLSMERNMIGSPFLPGLKVYFEQLKNVENFNILCSNQEINLFIQSLLKRYGSVYLVKHPSGRMLGVNTICDDYKGKMVFFANSGSSNKLDAREIADMLVDDMDTKPANIVGDNDKIAEFRKIFAQIFPEELDCLNVLKIFPTVLDSICYKDKKSAATEIRGSGRCCYLDFAAVRKSISVTAIVAFFNKLKSDQKFKAEFLAGFAKQQK